MRAWGLACGLRDNGIEPTIAINQSFPQKLKEHESIKLVNWELNDAFAALINSFDAVLVSYTMGDPSVFIVDHINDDVQLILDAYVPIYVEVSARNAIDMPTEMRHYMADVHRYNHVLKRGDYFLCASASQRTFYIGVLSALGVINPRSYRDDRIITAPFGIHNIQSKAALNPYKKLGIKPTDFTVMWFGGLYPWFRIQELLDAILELSKHKDFKFVIVGGQNPFNSNPDFAKQYNKTKQFAEKHKLVNRSLFFVDWVDFNDRVNWFRNANIVVSLNQPGEENSFAWRTRVMDFVWGELAILTNGGDPLSEDLLSAKAALRLPTLSAKAINDALQKVYQDRKALDTIRKNLIALKPKYYWEHICEPIAQVIETNKLPFQDELAFKDKYAIDQNTSDHLPTEAPAGRLQKIKKLMRLPRRALSYAKHKGLRRSARAALAIAQTQFASRAGIPRDKQYVFISPPINNTGAPIVLLQIVKEYAQKYGGKNVRLVAQNIDPAYVRGLRQLGVRIDKATQAFGLRMVSLQLDLRHDDFVLMNTVAIYDNYRDYIVHALGTGKLKHAYWFIHEDKAQLPVAKPDFLDKNRLQVTHDLITRKQLTILVPSERTKHDYDAILDVASVKAIPLVVDVPKKYTHARSEEDYKDIRFLLSGTASDGRKGQVLAIAALYDFMQRYYQKNPQAYRAFHLDLFSVGNDYISQQIRWMSDSMLKNHVTIFEPMPLDEVLANYAKCNAVICCSLNETFGLFVAEGMFMGQVVLRNNAAGVDEQLKDGKNGYFIDHTNIQAFADVIEKVLNKKKTSNAKLQAMGAVSQHMAKTFAKGSYMQKIERLK